MPSAYATPPIGAHARDFKKIGAVLLGETPPAGTGDFGSKKTPPAGGDCGRGEKESAFVQ